MTSTFLEGKIIGVFFFVWGFARLKPAAAIGFAKQHLDFDSPLRKLANAAIYPFYLLHQPVIVVLGALIIKLDISDRRDRGKVIDQADGKRRTRTQPRPRRQVRAEPHEEPEREADSDRADAEHEQPVPRVRQLLVAIPDAQHERWLILHPLHQSTG